VGIFQGECSPASQGEFDAPNPASVFCEQQGFRLEIRTAADGSRGGVCIFPDAANAMSGHISAVNCRALLMI